MQNVSIQEKEFRMYGMAGGQLEFVSCRVKWKYIEVLKMWQPYMIVRFTDHDAPNLPLCGDTTTLIEGVFYEAEFPLYQ